MHKLLIILVLFIFNVAYAQTHYEPQMIKNREVIFFVNNVGENISTDIISQLNNVPIEELDDAIITYLIGTGKYQNVYVKELYNKEQKKITYLVTAHNAKKIQNIIFIGVSSSEQGSFQKNLTLQAGKIFREYLVAADTKKIENNIQFKGYPNAHVVGYQVKPVADNLVNLVYTVDKGAPCQIDQVVVENSSANILNFINLPIETGSLCDVSSIKDKLSQIRNNYWREGYLTAETKIKDIAYSPNKERAKLDLIIEKGPKTIVQIQDENNKFLSLDFLNSKQSALTYSDLLLSSDSDLNSGLVSYYQNLGFPYVVVKGPEKVIENNKNVILKFTVKRGDFVKIGDIYFVGDLSEKKEDIIKELQLDKGFFSSDIPFVQTNLVVYKDKFKNIFLRDGYADAQVSLPDFNFSPDGGKANLVFNAISGDKYVISDVEIKNLPEGFLLKSKKLSRLLPAGSAINIDNKQSYVEELRSELLDQGYLYSQIQLEQITKQAENNIKYVTLIVKIDSGPVVKVGKIYAQGDLFHKEKTILSISGLEEGEIFTQHLLDSAGNRISRHDLFSSVSVEPQDPGALERKDAVLDIVIRVRGKTGYLLTLSPGWGDLRGYRFTTDYSLYKITDDGLHLIASAGVSQEKQQSSFASTDTRQILGEQFNLGFAEPLFKLGPVYTPLDLSTVAGYQQVAETLTNRQYQTFKLSSDWKPTFFNYNWTFTSTLIHEKSTSTSAESAVVQTIDSPTLVIREWLNSVSIDTRNNPAWPTSGGLFSFGFGMARFGLGSDVQYNRYIPKANFYFPIYKKLSGALLMGGNFVFDTVNRYGDTVTPPASRRSTLTDEALIRGFPETYGAAAPGPLLWIHYSPQSQAQNCNTQLASVGGTNLMYLKAEGRYRFNDIWGMVAFVDSGESFFSQKEVTQINNQMNSQINPTSFTSGQCTVDQASLIAPDTPNFDGTNFVEQYWRQAYVSTGLGLRVILGNIASISFDYGYPLKDPSQHDGNCMNPTDAQNASSPPKCVSRFQSSSYGAGKYSIEFKGAFNLGIGAQF